MNTHLKNSLVGAGQRTHVVARLSTVDRFLPLWIGAAMVLGLVLGRLVRGLNGTLDAVKVGQTSLPIALPGAAADDVPGAGEGPLRRDRPDRRSLASRWLPAT